MRFNIHAIEKALFILLIFLIVGFFGTILFINFQEKYQTIGESPKTSDLTSTTPVKVTDTPSAKSPTTIRDSVLLDVSFTSQAPLSNWDATHEETCEEASLLMAKYFAKKANLPSDPNTVDRELLALVEWEKAYGYGIDVTVKQLSEIAKTYYGMGDALIIENPTVNDIKEQLNLGRPVIVPAAGKLLPNPNFRNGGPVYHMFIIKGYDATNFITNDPGTRKGNGFTYAYNDLMNAIHDWDATNILNGRRTVLVFEN